MRELWERIKFTWRVAVRWPWLMRLAEIRAGSAYEGARFGVIKSGLDVDLKSAHNETLRREAIEWAGHWYREAGLKPHPWEVRIAVELAVGELKGYLNV